MIVRNLNKIINEIHLDGTKNMSLYLLTLLTFVCFFVFSPLRCVILVALRDIEQGEELFSNYYTIVS